MIIITRFMIILMRENFIEIHGNLSKNRRSSTRGLADLVDQMTSFQGEVKR